MKANPILPLLLLIGNVAFAQRGLLIDSKATPETVALQRNLMKLSDGHTLFGHQHATEYGHGWSGDDNRSDVKSVTGSHPAVIGVDFMSFTVGTPESIETSMKAVRKTVVDTYNRGGVVTAAWHFSNPVSNDGFNWKNGSSSPAVPLLIPGGSAYEKYKEILRTIGQWAKDTKGADGKTVPMIFRPYHEFDGGWFWWGRSHCSRDEFISLWRFTVSYLKDSVGVHNFIYAFSPDNLFRTKEQYLDRYPGDAFVDLLGTDNYGDMGRDRYDLAGASAKLKIVADYAAEAGKLAAFTETGLESIPNPSWWTGTLLKVMKTYPMRLAYVLVWRNDTRSATHFYAPFPDQVSVPDFLEFYKDPYTLFEGDLKGIYQLTVDN